MTSAPRARGTSGRAPATPAASATSSAGSPSCGTAGSSGSSTRPAIPPEAGYLALDSSAAERELGWAPAWDLERALRSIVDWHEARRGGEDMGEFSLREIERFARDSL